ncbi:helix-turn-helix transcriptional regulator [Saccharomonospora piscinae]|uniref:helix-turn-helix domain-containing protein n=1 Tax=Saccharomonospora piscinae TaxID=687388 RepID=UPI001105BAB5|nr:helix-turn-helix transcriptional regulator [Saccharomonospora piscinae]TLW91722.1 helix-turn-helix transcriptional regulator [Saccharomonospora piscinae]
MHEHVEDAINLMWQRYDEPLTMTDLAGAALLSKFHFTRVFRMATGTSPGRFLAAVRFYRAKHLLLRTSLSITDISYCVGYNSLGTFTTRFAKCVGVAPGQYRQLARTGTGMVAPPGRADDPAQCGTVFGRLAVPPSDRRIRVYVGVFESPILQGTPVSCDIVEYSGHYLLSAVPPGEWYVCAAAVEADNFDVAPWERKPMFFGSGVPVSVRAASTSRVDIALHPTRALDPPILMVIPELDSCKPPAEIAAMEQARSS